ncbi:MAG: hypothetical protein HUU60_11935 [Armatimonadetes bacterium]|nr:hypothetical protein [Armatimonadota bacterium]
MNAGMLTFAGLLCLAGGAVAQMRSDKADVGRVRFLAVSGLAVLLVSLLNEPAPWFAEGSRFGFGFALTMAFWFASLIAPASFAMVAALPAPWLALVLAPDQPTPVLLGCMAAAAAGWVVTNQSKGAAAMAVIAFAAALDLIRRWQTPEGYLNQAWVWAPAWLAVGAAVAVVLAQGASRNKLSPPPWPILLALCGIGLAVGCGLAFWQSGLQFGPRVWIVCVVSAGLVVFSRQNVTGPVSNAALFLWVGAVALLFAIGQALAVSLGALFVAGIWASLAPSDAKKPSPEVDLLAAGAAIFALVALFRIYVETFPLPSPRADVYQPYALIALILGAGLPLALAQSARSHWLSRAAAGLIAALLPLTVAAGFGLSPAAGYLAGGVACVAVVALWSERQTLISTSSYVLTGTVSAIAFAAKVEAYSDASRSVRGYLLAGAAVLFLLLLAVAQRKPSTSSEI